MERIGQKVVSLWALVVAFSVPALVAQAAERQAPLAQKAGSQDLESFPSRTVVSVSVPSEFSVAMGCQNIIVGCTCVAAPGGVCYECGDRFRCREDGLSCCTGNYPPSPPKY